MQVLELLSRPDLAPVFLESRALRNVRRSMAPLAQALAAKLPPRALPTAANTYAGRKAYKAMLVRAKDGPGWDD